MKCFRFISFFVLLFTTFAGDVSAASLKGHVWVAGSNNVPIANATVTIMRITPDSVSYQTTSQADGSYAFNDIETGTYFALCAASNFEHQSVTNVVVTPSGQELNFFLEPLPTGSLRGVVRDATSALPISYALVTIVSADELLSYRVNATGDGSYVIEHVEAGTYTAFCEAFGYDRQTIANVVIGESTTQLDFSLQATKMGVISGRVVFDGSGEPVADAFIQCINLSVSGRVGDAMTNAQGEYSAEVAVGDYIVRCHPNKGDSSASLYHEYFDNVLSIDRATIVKVSEGQTTANINFGVPQPAPIHEVKISGKVTDENNAAIESATVMVWMNGVQNSIDPPALTDAQGKYAVSIRNGLRLGQNIFIVMAEKDGFAPEYNDEKTAFYLADPIIALSDTTIDHVDFTLAAKARSNYLIRGKVMDEHGAPLANVMVSGINRANSDSTEVVALTQASGEYELEVQKAGTYVVAFAAYSYAPEFFDDVAEVENAKPIFVSGIVNDLNASLTYVGPASGRGVVGGKVLNSRQKPVSSVLVTARNANGTVVGFDYTDDQGGYAVAGLRTGSYTIHTSKVSYRSESQLVSLAGSEVPTAVVNFSIGNLTTGVDSENNEVPLPEAHILSTNYPNPFSPQRQGSLGKSSTTITFTLPQGQNVRLTIFNALGQEVKQLLNGFRAAGTHTATWDGQNARGQQAGSGLYFYMIETAQGRTIHKMLLAK